MFTIKNNSKRIIATIALMALVLIIPMSFYQPVKADPKDENGKTSVASELPIVNNQNGDNNNNSGSGDYSLDSLGNAATNAIGDVQKTVVGIAIPLGTLVIIILLVCTIVSHDERKISGYIKIIAIVLAALVLILIVSNGAVKALVEDFANTLNGK